MTRMASVLTLVAVRVLAHPLGVAGSEAIPKGRAAPSGGDDYRAKVYTACSFMFAAILIYLIASFRQNAKLRDELDFAARRIGELENPGSGASSDRGGTAKV